MGEGSTVYVAAEISDKSWVGGIGLPVDPGKVWMHMLTPADTDGLVAKIDQACPRAGGFAIRSLSGCLRSWRRFSREVEKTKV